MKFEKEDVLLNVNVADKESLLKKISEYAEEIGFTNDPEGLLGSFKKREEEYRTSLANAISELENLKERDQLLKDKLRYIEETKAYRLFLKEKVKKLGLWDKIQQDHL